MKQRVNQITKWSNFKAKREKIIDMYIRRKRQEAMIKSVLIQMIISKVISNQRANFKEGVRQYKIYLNRIFISLKICKIWNKK